MYLLCKLNNLASFEIEVQLPIKPERQDPYCYLPRHGTIPFHSFSLVPPLSFPFHETHLLVSQYS